MSTDDPKNKPDRGQPGEGGKPEREPEYRLVQIENAQYTEADDEIDLVELIKRVWQGRRTVIYSVIAFMALGLFIALGTAPEYEAEVRLMPEAESDSPAGGRLGGLAQQFGVGGVGGGSRTEGIPPNLYPDITNSLPLMQSLMNHRVHIERYDTTATLARYLTEFNAPDAVSVAQKYTIQLPFTLVGGVRSLFDEPEQDPESLLAEQPEVMVEDPSPIERVIRMNRMQWEVVETLRERINTTFNEENGLINVSVQMRDPEVAAEVAAQVEEFLTDYIKAYRTDKLRENVAFIEERYEEKKQEFEEAQEALARFRDEHRGQLTEMARTREQRLQSEYDLAFNVYNSMAERLEEARIELQEETPVVNVIEPAAVPDRRSSPRRGLIMIVSVMLGGMVGLGLLFGRHMKDSIRERWDEY